MVSVISNKTISLKMLRMSSFLVIGFFPSIILINSSLVLHSFPFVFQYLFLIIIVPIFISSLFTNDQVFLFFRLNIYLGLIFSFLYFLNYYIPTLNSFGARDWSTPYLNGYTRFSFGDFSPNEMGHFLIFILFCVSYLYKSLFDRILIVTLFLPAYIFTLSKTVYIQIISFFYFYIHKSKYYYKVCFFIFFIFLMTCILFPIVLDRLISRLSPNYTNNQIRVNMLKDFLDNIDVTFLSPAYHVPENVNFLISVSNHNYIASFITNFGIFSFSIFIIYSMFFYVRFKNRKVFQIVLPFIILDLISGIFNPMLNSRIIWLPLFLYFSIIIKDVHPLNEKSKCKDFS